MSGVLIWLGGASAVAYWPMAGRDVSALRSVFKTLAVAALALAAIISGAPWLLMAALALGSLGDFCLSRDGEAAFLTGLISFAAAHLAVAGFFVVYGDATWAGLMAAPSAVLISLLLFAVAMTFILLPRAGALRIPVSCYIAIIVAMGAAALAMPDSGLREWAVPAAGLFMASDAILGFEMFAMRRDHPARGVTSALIWPLYWLAQLGFLMMVV